MSTESESWRRDQSNAQYYSNVQRETIKQVFRYKCDSDALPWLRLRFLLTARRAQGSDISEEFRNEPLILSHLQLLA